MDHKYASLMESTDARWTIRETDKDVETILSDLKKAEMTKYFILGSMATINKYMEAVIRCSDEEQQSSLLMDIRVVIA